jgi:hypothetical protein
MSNTANKINTQAINTWDQLINENISGLHKIARDIEKNRDAESKQFTEDRAWVMEQMLNNSQKAYETASKAGKINPSFEELVTDSMNQSTRFGLKAVRAADPKEGAVYATQQQQYQKTVNVLKQIAAIGKQTNTDYLEDYWVGTDDGKNPMGFSNVGQQGGMSTAGEDTALWDKTMQIRNGLVKGEEKFFADENGEVWVTYSGGFLKEPVTKPALMWLQYDPGTIFKLDDHLKKKLDEGGYLNKEGTWDKKFLDYSKSVVSPNEEGTMEVTYVPYNQRQIGASLSKMFKTMATSALQDYKMANNIWRNIFQPKFGDKYPSMARDLKIGNTIPGSPIDQKDQDLFVRAYMEYAKDKFIPDYEITNIKDLTAAELKDLQEDPSARMVDQDGDGEPDAVETMGEIAPRPSGPGRRIKPPTPPGPTKRDNASTIINNYISTYKDPVSLANAINNAPEEFNMDPDKWRTKLEKLDIYSAEELMGVLEKQYEEDEISAEEKKAIKNRVNNIKAKGAKFFNIEGGLITDEKAIFNLLKDIPEINKVYKTKWSLLMQDIKAALKALPRKIKEKGKGVITFTNNPAIDKKIK